MWPLLLLLSISAFAQEELDLSTIRDFEEKLPSYGSMGVQEGVVIKSTGENKYLPPVRKVSLKRILKSEIAYGATRKGTPIQRIEDNKIFSLQKSAYVRHYEREDEQGFKYIINKDGSCTYRIDSNYVSPIKEEMSLYEPPLKYTPAPLNIVRHEYDKKLNLLPEASLYVGYVMSDFMKDLFNDSKAGSGITNQFGAHLFTDWKLPYKIGAVLHYEKATYDLTGGGQVLYSSLSFGPQFKTKDYDCFSHACRFQLQYRISPFAKATAQMVNGATSFKFNSSDLMASFEHPVKNGWGDFVLGAFLQVQWLNIKDQSEIVSLRASNRTNNALGLSFSQVFH